MKVLADPTLDFEGNLSTGMAIKSPRNQLILETDPVEERLFRSKGLAHYKMGSSSARLKWAGRDLEGRIIYEYLRIPDFNRLTRTSVGLWKEFQGIYLRVEEEGDLYLHSQQSEFLEPLVGGLEGFIVVNGKTERFRRMHLNAYEYEQALGFYRWPMRWLGTWMGEDGPGFLKIQLSERTRIANWIIGGGRWAF